MKFMNQNRFYGRMYREEAGGEGGEGDAGGGTFSFEYEGQSFDNQEALTSFIQGQGSEIERLNHKIGEANKHAKAAEKKAAEEAKQKAEAEGNYQQLYESSQSELAKAQEAIASRDAADAKREEKLAAMKIASTLADGENVELLAEFLGRRLKYVDGSVKVTDESGGLTVSSLEELSKEFAGSARYASLLKGNQSSGGGAAGGSSGGGTAVKTMSRADFDALSPGEKMKFTKEGGKIAAG